MNSKPDYDSEFLEFSRSIAANDPLYPMRDLLFNSFYYKQIGHRPLPRHRFGIFSWLVWAFINGRAINWKETSLPESPDASNTLNLLIGGHSGAHWMTLRPIAQDAIQSGTLVRLWTLGEFRELESDPVWSSCQVRNVSTLTQPRRPGVGVILKSAIASIRLGRSQGFSGFGNRASQMADALMNYHVWKSAWRQLLETVGCKTALVTSEASSINKAFVHAAVDMGAKACHLCHGLPFETHSVTAATDLFAFSRIDAAWFAGKVSSRTKIHSIGNPRMEKTREEVIRPDSVPLHDPIHILFLSNGLENPYTAEQEAQDMAILKLPEDIRIRTILRVRPHPRELREMLESSLNRAGLKYEISGNRSLSDDLIWADICATPWSTSLLEAIVCEKPSFWINARNDRMARTGEYIDAGLGTLVMRAEEWERLIHSFIESPENAERFRLRDCRLKETGLIPHDDQNGWYRRLVDSIGLAEHVAH